MGVVLYGLRVLGIVLRSSSVLRMAMRMVRLPMHGMSPSAGQGLRCAFPEVLFARFIVSFAAEFQVVSG